MARLSKREKQLCSAGGFRLERRRWSRAASERARLRVAARILRAWGAGPDAVRRTLALPSARALARWRRGEAAITAETHERIAVVLALGRRLTEAGDVVTLRPLPDLERPGRPALAAGALLAKGRFSDLLALLCQLVRAEENRASRAARRRHRR